MFNQGSLSAVNKYNTREKEENYTRENERKRMKKEANLLKITNMTKTQRYQEDTKVSIEKKTLKRNMGQKNLEQKYQKGRKTAGVRKTFTF